MDISSVNNNSASVNLINVKKSCCLLHVVKKIFVAIGNFFNSLLNAVKLTLLGKVAIRTYNDSRDDIFYMYQTYITRGYGLPAYDDFYTDFNRCFMKVERLDQGKEIEPFFQTIVNLVSDEEGANRVTRIMHQGMIAFPLKNIVEKTGVLWSGLRKSEDLISTYLGVRKEGSNIVILAANILNPSDPSISKYMYTVRKTIIPASRLANLQSVNEFRTEEFYSKMMTNRKGAIAAFYKAINEPLPNSI